MSARSLAIYAERARVLEDPILATALYADSRGLQPRVLADIITKLHPRRTDTLLDIGAGVGLNTMPLSLMVRSTCAVDHADCLMRMKHSVIAHGPIQYAPGDFLTFETGDTFSRILVYRTIHYLSSAAELLRFFEKALGLLAPGGGRALFGDLPNVDLKKRWLATPRGRQFHAHWSKQPHDDGSAALSLSPDTELVAIDDALILDMVRRASLLGCYAQVLSQPADLPFGYTREDLLVERP